MLLQLLLLPCCYLLGSTSPSYLLTRWLKSADLRDLGSGNLGATNAMRVLGWRVGLVVLLLDLGKGLAAVAVAQHFTEEPIFHCVAGLTTILGHVFPIFLNFRGGKGVATTAGVLVLLDPLVFGLSLACFTAAFLISKIVSLSSLVAAATLGLGSLAIHGPTVSLSSRVSQTVTFIVISALVFWRHRDNISRLFANKEAAVGESTQDSKTHSSKESSEHKSPE